MILPSPRARRWLIVGLALFAVAIALYAHYRRTVSVRHGGTAYGLAFGIAAAILILVLLAYGLRRRAYRSTFGTLDGWLQAHVYLGLLCAVVAYFHASGGRWHDRLATWTFVVLLVVVGSGLLGVLGYRAVPRRLSSVESNLTADEISDQLNQLARSMARMATGRSAAFRRIYERLLEQAVPPDLAGWRLLFVGVRPATKSAESDFSRLLPMVAEDERAALRQLLVLSRQRQELYLRLRAQQRYRNLLQVWLYLHLPLSLVLLVLLVAHVLAAAYFGALA